MRKDIGVVSAKLHDRHTFAPEPEVQYLNLFEAAQDAEDDYRHSQNSTLEARRLSVTARRAGGRWQIYLTNIGSERGGEARFSEWALRQTCALIGFPFHILNGLSVPAIVAVLQDRLEWAFSQDPKWAERGFHFVAPMLSWRDADMRTYSTPRLRALPSATYRRVWDAQMLEELRQNLGDLEVVRLTRSGTEMGIWLVNRAATTCVGAETLSPAMLVRNSEVGARSAFWWTAAYRHAGGELVLVDRRPAAKKELVMASTDNAVQAWRRRWLAALESLVLRTDAEEEMRLAVAGLEQEVHQDDLRALQDSIPWSRVPGTSRRQSYQEAFQGALEDPLGGGRVNLWTLAAATYRDHAERGNLDLMVRSASPLATRMTKRLQKS